MGEGKTVNVSKTNGITNLSSKETYNKEMQWSKVCYGRKASKIKYAKKNDMDNTISPYQNNATFTNEKIEMESYVKFPNLQGVHKSIDVVRNDSSIYC